MSSNNFGLLRDLARLHDETVMLFNVWKVLMVSQHPVKLGGYRHSGSKDIMILVRDGMPYSNTRNFRSYTQQFARVANERLPILVTHVYKNN